jgi:hypothetical protein
MRIAMWEMVRRRSTKRGVKLLGSLLVVLRCDWEMWRREKSAERVRGRRPREGTRRPVFMPWGRSEGRELDLSSFGWK